MDVLTIPRTALDRSLRVLRIPLDSTIAVLDREGDKGAAVSLGLDRADAAVRRFAGRLLRDGVLQQDAQARSVAVDERQRAAEARAEAELRRRQSDAEFQTNLETAEKQRADAEHRADRRRTRVDEERQTESRRLAEETDKRKTSTRKAAQSAERRIDERAQKARLEQLEKESQVLDAKEQSITTASEAQRLQRAASEAKRKRTSG